ncbi:hypothetical protein A3F28_00100 [Candidatus Uhrbacteria bacterium RIFCSPHIGHO2_12_FULL_57_11]|uniref:Bifunctional protein FolD n=1 Tax=Candidatus Uhrbacteria bacterium RIFCSPHIGHO2_12_FULL_57_11 TaxID=1802398 RepID=A0A1F7UN88_9BACT|nr:MAG: hypothetical protein A3F28_00100 [Candidatus Uhrbacteria bacterium RIFCSPHIGHO2_12_FULL_57_11]
MFSIDGRSIAAGIRAQIKHDIARLGITPGLGVILAGADPASHLYVGLKEKACSEVGIKFEKALFFATEPEEKILEKIREFNGRPDIHGILIQLPLPRGYDEDRVIAEMNPAKDADGFHPANLELIKQKNPNVIPGVSLGIMRLIESTGTDLAGKKAALIVNSEIFALPLTYLLEKKGTMVEAFLAPRFPADVRRGTLETDIVVVAVGRAGFIRADMVKDGAIIVDVGTNRVEGKLAGDADFDSFRGRDIRITPVPGGVGPMTVAMLLHNVLELAKRAEGEQSFVH